METKPDLPSGPQLSQKLRAVLTARQKLLLVPEVKRDFDVIYDACSSAHASGGLRPIEVEPKETLALIVRFVYAVERVGAKGQ